MTTICHAWSEGSTEGVDHPEPPESCEVAGVPGVEYVDSVPVKRDREHEVERSASLEPRF